MTGADSLLFCGRDSVEVATSPVIVAVVGGSASGKTSAASCLAQMARGLVLSQDDYYKPIGDRPLEYIDGYNFDEPAAIDFDLMRSHLDAISKGIAFERPEYDFVTHTRIGVSHVEPHSFVVVEGSMLLCDMGVRRFFAHCVFVDASEKTRLARRVDRDVRERGFSEERARASFDNFVEPMHELHVEPTRSLCDFVIDNNGRRRKLEEQVKVIYETIAAAGEASL